MYFVTMPSGHVLSGKTKITSTLLKQKEHTKKNQGKELIALIYSNIIHFDT